jgi:hypothetical protein
VFAVPCSAPLLEHNMPESPTLRRQADLTDETSRANESSTIEYLLRNDAEPVRVVLFKETDGTRIGIGLRPDVPDRAIVFTVAPGTPADGRPLEGGDDPAIMPYDELLAVGGEECTSAAHAVKLIREAPAGELEIEKVPCPPEVTHATLSAQTALRAAMRRKGNLSQKALVKPQADMALGLSFSPEFMVHSVIATVKEGSLAATALQVGDVLKWINGVPCGAPADTARLLRGSSGTLDLLIVPAAKRDEDAMVAAEEAARAELARAEAAAARAQGGGDYDDDDDDDDDDEAESEAGSPRPHVQQPRAAAVDPFPSGRPSPVATGGGSAGRRLPPSLSRLASPAGSERRSSEPSPNDLPAEVPTMPPPSKTSGTRSAGPPLAAGAKPQGWRDWLQQRRAMATAVTKPAPAKALDSPSQRI